MAHTTNGSSEVIGSGTLPNDIPLTSLAEEMPIAADDEFVTDETSGVVGNLFADNGSGADIAPGAIVAINGDSGSVGNQITLASGALLTVNSNGSFAYDPNGAFQFTPTTGSGAYNTPSADSFSYTIAGGDTATVVFTITGIDNDDTIIGSEGDNRLIGGTGNDNISGLGGVDYITGGFGDDLIFGDNGVDRAGWYQVDEALGGETVSLLLQGTPQDTGSQGWDTLFDIENLSGTPFADVLIGNDNDNWLWGSPATISLDFVSTSNNDYLDGQGGDDLLTVGLGNHTVIGGTGVDTLRFTENGYPEPALYVDLSLQGGPQDTGAGSWTLSDIENVVGGTNNDLIIGDDFDNLLAGYIGNDILLGGGGNDLLLGDGFVNVNTGGVSTITYDRGSDGGNDSLRGHDGDDILIGGAGNDFLNGGTGDDVIDGGLGVDRAAFYEDAGPEGVTVDLNLQGVAQNTGQGMDTLIGIENVSGSIYGDHLIGDEGDNQLWGSASTLTDGTIVTTNNDVLNGNGGNDLLVVGIGNHVVDGGSGIDTFRFTENGAPETGITLSLLLQGAAQASGNGNWTLTNIENLSGSSSGDTLIGDGNANVLAGDLGDDFLFGEGGDDTLYGDGAIVVNAPGSGAIETFADVVASLGGVSGNDTLEGAEGNDQLYGGGGSDTASYVSASGNVSVFLYDGGFGEAVGAAGYDQLHDIENITGSSFNDILYGNNVANVVAGGDGHDDVRGGDGNDEVRGGSGDDLLYGNAGDDLLDGGEGSDRVGYFSGATAGVMVNLNLQGVAQDTGQGWDTLIGIENVSGTQFNDTLIGDDNHNWLWGSASTIAPGNIVTTNNDNLSGGGGNDLLIVGIGNHIVDGGTGIDTFRFNENGAPETGITLSLTLQGTTQSSGNGDWTLTDIENLSGSVGNDSLTGDLNANLLAGDLGDDVLVGGAGDDTLYGDGQVNWNSNGTGRSGPITTFVDATGNYVGGVPGNDILEGGLGNDVLDGGGGIDVASYAHASADVTVNLLSGASSGADGNDTLSNIENVVGSEFGDRVTGDSGTNVLYGLGGNDTLFGGAGNDTLFGGEGADLLLGDLGEGNLSVAGNDILYGEGGNDLLRGGLGDDQLYGGEGNDLLRGNGGVDYFDGGANDPVSDSNTGDRISFYDLRATQGVVADLRTGIISNDGFGNVEAMTGIESLGSGTAYADMFFGNDDRNYLAGDIGDQIYGFGGDDLFQLTSAAAFVDGGSGYDRIFIFAAGSFLLPDTNGDGLAEVADFATAGYVVDFATGTIVDGYGNSGLIAGIEELWGSELGDILIGDASANVFYGQAGDDSIEGRAGNDTLDGGSGIDTASYVSATGGVTVNLQAGTSSGADGNDTLANFENVAGSEFDDNLTGDGAANLLYGLGGNDTLSGGSGDDTLYGGDGNDFLQGDLGEHDLTVSGDDILYGEGGNDQLRGGLGDDQLYGGDGNDLLRGNGGVDYFDGGANDPFDDNNIGDRVGFFDRRATEGAVADLRTGIISNDGFGNVETMVGIESLGSGTAYADIFYGNDDRNYLAGDVGDQVYGFGGDDRFQLTSAAAVVDGGSGYDRVLLFASGSYLLPDSNGDGLAEFASPASTGYTVDFSAGTIADGYGNFGAITAIEELWGSELGDVLTGDGSANTFFGQDGDDLINGRGGNDTLDGGLGTDTVSYANAAGSVVVNLASGTATGADGNDTLVNFENVAGGAFNDTLSGDGGANTLAGGSDHDSLNGRGGNDTLQGGDGNDSITGGAGDDVIDGGAGFDRASYNVGATTGVTVNLSLSGAQNTGQGFDTLVGIENVVGTIYNDVLTGDGADNWLWGGSLGTGVTGNDTISGGDGNDLVEVGAGNHTLSGGNGAGDTLTFWGGGTDISSTGVVFTLASTGAQNTRQGTMSANGFENLSGSRHGDILTGDGNSNILAGNTGNDTLSGGAGADMLYGDGGYTTFTSGGIATGPIRLIADVTTEFGGIAGADNLNGGDGDDFLYGGGGNDMLKGDRDNDTLFGGTGNDTLVGGQGNDRYIIEGNSGADTISGFTHADRIVFDTSSGVTSYTQLTFTKVGGTSTLITWGNGNSILVDLKPGDLTASDFLFEGASAGASAQGNVPNVTDFSSDYSVFAAQTSMSGPDAGGYLFG